MTGIVEDLLRTKLCNEELSLTLENKIAALSPGQAALREFLEQRAVGERGIYEVELVFEELFTNTVRHGYADPATHYIEVKLQLSDDAIVMTFDDDARGFDPTAGALPVLPSSLDEVKTGGLGLTLVRKAAREMRYQRVHDRNHLRLSIPRA
jgi:anti-sigma regulatory factor (Ser/Thr protein kinase)